MPARLAPGQRERILADLRSGMSVRAAARKHGCSHSTVSGYAKAAGIATDRSATKKATEAHVADHAAVLAALAGRAGSQAGQVLASFESMTQEQWAKISVHTRAITFGILADKARELAPADDEAQASAAKSLLSALLDGLISKHGDDAGN